MKYDGPPPSAGMPEAQLRDMTQRITTANAWKSAGYVYVFAAREFVKVGTAINVNRRWRALRTANPMLEPALYITQRLQHAASVEAQIHRQLAESRIPGTEWFTCSRGHVVELVQRHEQNACGIIRISANSEPTST